MEEPAGAGGDVSPTGSRGDAVTAGPLDGSEPGGEAAATVLGSGDVVATPGVRSAPGGGITAKVDEAGSGGSLANHRSIQSISVTVGNGCSERAVVLSPSCSRSLRWLALDELMLGLALC